MYRYPVIIPDKDVRLHAIYRQRSIPSLKTGQSGLDSRKNFVQLI